MFKCLHGNLGWFTSARTAAPCVSQWRTTCMASFKREKWRGKWKAMENQKVNGAQTKKRIIYDLITKVDANVCSYLCLSKSIVCSHCVNVPYHSPLLHCQSVAGFKQGDSCQTCWFLLSSHHYCQLNPHHSCPLNSSLLIAGRSTKNWNQRRVLCTSALQVSLVKLIQAAPGSRNPLPHLKVIQRNLLVHDLSWVHFRFVWNPCVVTWVLISEALLQFLQSSAINHKLFRPSSHSLGTQWEWNFLQVDVWKRCASGNSQVLLLSPWPYTTPQIPIYNNRNLTQWPLEYTCII